MGYLRFLAANPLFLSFGFGLNVCLALGQTFYVSLFNADIQADLLLSHGELAAVYGFATILGSVFVLVLGRLLDHVDLRLFTGVVSVAVATGCFLLSRADTVVTLFIAILMVRFTAQGLWGVSAQVSMARYFESERGKAAAVANAGYALGYAVFPLIGAFLLATYGWRDAWQVTGMAVLFGALPLMMVQLRGHGERHRRYEARLKELEDLPDEQGERQWKLKQVLGDVRFWLLQPGVLAVSSIIFAIQFHQLYIVETKGWTLPAFASGYSVYAAMSLFATLLGGAMVDKLGSLRLIAWYLWPLLPALILLALFDHPIVIFGVMAMNGFTFGLGLVVFVTLYAEMYGTKHMGAIRSFNVFFNVTMASAVMVLTGWLIDRDVSIAAMCAGGIAFILLSLVLLEAVKRMDAPVPKPAS